MNPWLIVCLVVLGLLTICGVSAMFLIYLQRSTALILTALANQPIPPVQKETVVKVVQIPPQEESQPQTVSAFVAEVAAEHDAAGTPLTLDEIQGQKEGWEDYGIEHMH
jgi:hypothetical protein